MCDSIQLNSKYRIGVIMPLYDYHCQQCKSDFTELRRTTEMDSPISCPDCGSMETSRSLSCFSVGGSTSGMTSLRGTSKSQFR